MSEQPAWMAFEGGNTNNTGAQDPSQGGGMQQPGGGGVGPEFGGGGGGQPQFVATPYSQVQQARTMPSVEDGGMDHSRSHSTDLTDPTSIRFGDPNDDRPLLEELGIFPQHIKAKAATVLHPFRTMNPEVVEDSDLAGPMVFAVCLGLLLTLQGKMQFGAVYVVSIVGIVAAKSLLSLMSDQPVSLQFVVSSLGYCLLPNIFLAGLQTIIYWIWGAGGVMIPVALVMISWSGWCATQMFVAALLMQDQRFLLLYPCFLFYATFAALTIF